MNPKKYCAIFSAMFCILACGTSCVYINEELGNNFIPTEQRYEIHVTDFPITEIGMQPVTQLSGYSSSRVTIGAILDENGNMSTRSSALTLIPAAKYDFGTGGQVTRFHLAMGRDTLSYINEGQKRILQDVNVYALTSPIDDTDGYISTVLEHGDRIADVATYDGSDSLSFDFRNEWAQEFLGKLQEMETSAYDSVGAFTQKVFPGIYMTIDTPVSTGGRINVFTLTTGADLNQGTLSGGYATMTVKNAEFNGRTVEDTTFMFLYGAQDFSIVQEASDYYSGVTLTPQYALNMSSSTLDGMGTDNATEEIIVEGGGGLKPVINARGLRDGMLAKLAESNIDPADVIINKATIVLPFTPTDYESLDRYPAVLSPSCKLTEKDEDGNEVATYAGITDTSVSTENQGEINRSTFIYSPDISYHMQQILELDEYDESDEEIVESYREKDIWLLIMSQEAAEEEQEGMSEYSQNLYYNMYYNQLYNNYYGYGGYGYGYGYGYGGYGYNNFYDYYALASLYSMQNAQSSSSSSTTTVLDRDRYFFGRLNGPVAASQDQNQDISSQRVPYMKVTYSVRQGR